MSNPGDFLCLSCRRLGHETASCPRWRSQDESVGPTLPDFNPGIEEEFLGPLTRALSSVCPRCELLDVVAMLSRTDIRDERRVAPSSQPSKWITTSEHDVLMLGPFRTISLRASCPVCRLIFRVFSPPPPDQDPGPTGQWYLRPFRMCHRQGDTLNAQLDGEQRHYALYLSLENREIVTQNTGRFLGDVGGQIMQATSYAFALSNKNPVPTQSGLSPRHVGPLVDWDIIRGWIQQCEIKHDDQCRTKWSDELLQARMIDVDARKVVPCPPHCKYLALSYVWGGVMPEENALERFRLPQTIEDSITVTKKLGFQYLWVDALCVDQKATPQQAQQLNMMDTIYFCAWATITALSSVNSDTGLAGVSSKTPRVPQGREMVGGRELVTLFPPIEKAYAESKWSTRAWTFQEGVFSHRRLIFADNECYLWCNCGKFYETVDISHDPIGVMDSFHDSSDDWLYDPMAAAMKYSDEALPGMVEGDYRDFLLNYTSRQLTNDGDSLNAFQGMLRHLERTFFKKPFVWGLPMSHFPQSLRWYHPRGVRPRRRSGFPSWSWCGWEGEAQYSGSLDLLKDKDERPAKYDCQTDMTVKFLGIRGVTLTVAGHLVDIEIRNEPFNDAYVPGTDTYLGSLRERDVLHPNTLPSGIFQFLVVERLRYKPAPDRPFREIVYMLMLNKEDGGLTRRTKVRLSGEAGMTFERAGSRAQAVELV